MHGGTSVYSYMYCSIIFVFSYVYLYNKINCATDEAAYYIKYDSWLLGKDYISYSTFRCSHILPYFNKHKYVTVFLQELKNMQIIVWFGQKGKPRVSFARLYMEQYNGELKLKPQALIDFMCIFSCSVKLTSCG